ncbi:MAG: DUF4268 domain-containing protein [Anaerolineae bacterium]
MDIGKLEIVPLREAFRHEAHNFTTWLENNIEALSERIGIELTVLEREKAVGSFTVDLFCEDDDGNTVIVENQLERTDHDHLGKLLTYMVNLDAKTAIWVATEVRQEHMRVIDWLNEATGADTGFYFVKVEAIRIGDSPYAPLFTVLAGPDEQTREIGEQKKEFAERHILREQFWTQLLERSKDRTLLTANRSASRDHWLSVAAGRSGVNYNYLILKDGAGIDLYIDVGDHDKNKNIFDRLHEQREAIEAEFGEPLDWRRLDDKRASRIVRSYVGEGSLHEQERWHGLQDLMINAMIRFDKVFRKRIRDVAG